jgi:hypothetical protein
MIVLYVLPDGSARPARVEREHGRGTAYWCADLTVSMPDGSIRPAREAYRDVAGTPGSWHPAPAPLAWPLAADPPTPPRKPRAAAKPRK